jgi:flagellar biosynthetic protein FliS
MSDTGLSYRKSAIEGASGIGLVIALYDTLWGDLRRAAEAIRHHDIELRCRELNHGTLVLGQLESWIATENGGDLAASLTQFYRHLRARMMEASVKQSAQVLEELMDLILHVRSAWQQRDLTAVDIGVPQAGLASTPGAVQDSGRVALSLSA